MNFKKYKKINSNILERQKMDEKKAFYKQMTRKIFLSK